MKTASGGSRAFATPIVSTFSAIWCGEYASSSKIMGPRD